MALKIKNSGIWNLETGQLVGYMTDAATVNDERSIELGSEFIPLIEDFVLNVNKGVFKPKTTVDQFQRILDKYP